MQNPGVEEKKPSRITAILWFSLATVLAIPLGFICVAIGYFAVLYIISMPNSLSFASRPLGFAIPLFLSGLLFGRLFPRWGFIPTLAAVLPAVIFSARFYNIDTLFISHFLFPLPAAILGWITSALIQRWKFDLTKALYCCGAAALIMFLAAFLLILPQRNKLMSQVFRAVRHFGVDPARYNISIRNNDTSLMFILLPLPGRSYDLEVFLYYSDATGKTERIQYGIDEFEFRNGLNDKIYLSRMICTNPPSAIPQSVKEAQALASKYGIPKSFLAALHSEGTAKQPYSLLVKGDASGYWAEMSNDSAPVFLTRPLEKGTWAHPGVQICGGDVTIRAGEAPD